MNFEHSAKAKELINRIQHFMDAHIFPLEKEYLNVAHHSNPDWKNWELDPRIEELKTKAKEEGLWNLFLPPVSGLSNLEYAPLAEITGQSLLAPEVFNCNAPDTGNMEVLWKYGSEEQKEKCRESWRENNQSRIGQKRGSYNSGLFKKTVWINNGEQRKRVPEANVNDWMLNGWMRGLAKTGHKK